MIRRILVPALKLAVSGALIWLALRGLDFEAAWVRLSDVSLGALALAGAMLVIQVAVCALRWGAVLAAMGSGLGFGRLFALFWLGAFLNQALPSTVGGDAVRVYMLYRSGTPLGPAVNGVMLERAATVYGLVLVVAAMLPLLAGHLGPAESALFTPGVIGLLALSTAGLAAVMGLDRLPGGLYRWQATRGLAQLARDARRVFLRPVNAARVLGWAVLGHANLSVAVWALLNGLGCDISYLLVLALFPLVVLAITVPVSIAGWGVREISMIAAFALVGVPDEVSTVASLLFGVVSAITSLPGGIFWLMEGATRRQALEAAARMEMGNDDPGCARTP